MDRLGGVARGPLRNNGARMGALASLGILGSVMAAPFAEAQQPRDPVIGFLSANSGAAMAGRVEAFRQGLLELGYVEGRNIHIRFQYAAGRTDRLPALAAELVQANVAIIITEGTTATRAAKEATATIPIVMAQDPDPVGTGFIASLAQPGGNITGLSNLRVELAGKRLELLKEALPGLARIAVIGTATTPGTPQSFRDTEHAASAMALQLKYFDIRSPSEIEPAFRDASAWKADAMLGLGSPILLSNRGLVAEKAAEFRLPAVHYSTEFVEDGGLMSYGVSIPDLFRRSATYVAKILKGAHPGDLPVEQPTKFELAINMKTASQLGLSIPMSIVTRADRIIE
jgi:putative tryptophan/tyrosine transport system substrate-binding protein